MTISESYKKLFIPMQYNMKNRVSDYSSEHEMAIFRAVTTSKNVNEAVLKINRLKAGRIAEETGERIIEGLLIEFSLSE